jgi:benzodiazapine receptor
MWRLLLASATPLLLGAASGLATRDGVQSAWYAGLRKPSWMPPAKVFGPVWTVLYVLMGVALWMAASAGAPPATLALFAAQLALNILWSFVFFKYRSLRWSVANIVTLLPMVLWTIVQFSKSSAAAGVLLVPYAAWIAFATLLNITLFLTNDPSR